MNSAQAFVGNLSELFTWIGLAVSGLCFLTLLLLRAIRGYPLTAEAVLAETPTGTVLRWMGADGEFRSRPLAEFERAQVTDPDELRVHYRRRSPDTVHLESIDHAEGVLRLLGLIFLGVFAAAVLASLVLLVVS